MHFMSALLGVYRAEIGLVILALMFVEFVRERYSPTVVSVLGACAYAALGLLDEKGLFSVFSNSAPLTIGAMFVLAGAWFLLKLLTGFVHRFSSQYAARRLTMQKVATFAKFFIFIGWGICPAGNPVETAQTLTGDPLVASRAASIRL
mgnify:CR=1 FL=1